MRHTISLYHRKDIDIMPADERPPELSDGIEPTCLASDAVR